MRDTLKDKNYFDNLIIKLYSSQERRYKKIKNNEIKLDRLKVVKRSMSGNFNRIITAKYSRGDDMCSKDLYDDYKKEVTLLNEAWEQNTGLFPFKIGSEIILLNQYGRSAYIIMLNRLSLGVLLNASIEDYILLVDYIDKDEVKDFLFEFLIKQLIPERKKCTQESYKDFFDINETFDSLKQVIIEDDKNLAQKGLKRFLEKEWYNCFKGTPLYNEHTNEHNTYSGYWCFVAAAIVKIKQLDDSSFKDNQYYPKDLIQSSKEQ